MRQLLLVSHRWVALCAAIFVLVVALTGSALVFEGAMDRALHPALWRVAPTPVDVSFDTLVARARAVAPATPITGISFAPVDDRADVVQAGALQVFVDPHTGAVLGTRSLAEWNRTLPRRLHVLHVSLMAGKIGGDIVGIVTIVVLLLVLTGVVLWWPDKIWQVRWSASWKRVVFDLHHVLGVVAALVLVVITLSGLAIHYKTLNALLYDLDRTPAPRASKQPAPATGARAISVDSLVASARRALPGARVMFVALPPGRDEPFVAAMRYPEDHTPGGRSRVIVDRYTGAPLQVTSTRQAQLGTRLGNTIRSIHTGDLFGKPTEAIWLLATLVLASQGVTGFIMWWNSRRARAARSARPRRAAELDQLEVQSAD